MSNISEKKEIKIKNSPNIREETTSVENFYYIE